MIKTDGSQAPTKRRVLISGASIAGLSMAYWMNRLGYEVTVVENAGEPRIGGAAVNIGGKALDIVRRMGIYDAMKADALNLQRWEFKNAADETITSAVFEAKTAESDPDDERDPDDDSDPDDDTNPSTGRDLEIERDKIIAILLKAIPDGVGFLFNDSVTAMDESPHDIAVTFRTGSRRAFHLVIGCDGLHSGVRKTWFGNESAHTYFLQHYFSLTIVNKLLIPTNTAQMFNTPGKLIMLNAYNNKTDICFCFHSPNEIDYNYRDADEQSGIVLRKFPDDEWRTRELLRDVTEHGTSYFDKFCQVKIPSWFRGRVALVGDAAHCASPAAGIGASLAIIGAAALADALTNHPEDYNLAFAEYEQALRPFVEEVQETAKVMLGDYLVPATEEAIRKRNEEPTPF